MFQQIIANGAEANLIAMKGNLVKDEILTVKHS